MQKLHNTTRLQHVLHQLRGQALQDDGLPASNEQMGLR